VGGAERENRPLSCSDRGAGRECRGQVFRQPGLYAAYAPRLYF
jgi:hypothetical protein